MPLKTTSDFASTSLRLQQISLPWLINDAVPPRSALYGLNRFNSWPKYLPLHDPSEINSLLDRRFQIAYSNVSRSGALHRLLRYGIRSFLHKPFPTFCAFTIAGFARIMENKRDQATCIAFGLALIIYLLSSIQCIPHCRSTIQPRSPATDCHNPNDDLDISC